MSERLGQSNEGLSEQDKKKASYSKRCLQRYGVGKALKHAQNLDSSLTLDIDRDESVLAFSEGTQKALLANPAVLKWAKKKRRGMKFLSDGKCGPFTLSGLELSAKKVEIDGMASGLDSQMTAERPYGRLARYSRRSIRNFGVKRFLDNTRKLGMSISFDINDDKSVVDTVIAVQNRLDAKEDGKFGPQSKGLMAEALKRLVEDPGAPKPALTSAAEEAPAYIRKTELSPDSPKVKAYLDSLDEIEEELDVAEVSRIPYTPRESGPIPPKQPGTFRVVLWGDSDSKRKKDYLGQDIPDQVGLLALQSSIRSGKLRDIDFVLSVGDHLPFGRRGDNTERYKRAVEHAKLEFQGFGDIPFAVTVGNHDLNKRDRSTNDDFSDTYAPKLKDGFKYEKANGAYSFEIGKATFVIFNKGDKKVTEAQVKFFEKKCEESEGAVYLVNHIPPVQHAHGPGLPRNRSQKTTNFDRIRHIARTNVENSGRPFYLLSGHDHFHHVIGNFINPGGTGANYKSPGGNAFKAQRSIAVADIDANGKIQKIYFRDSSSAFAGPLSQKSHELAWGRQAFEQKDILRPDMDMV